MVLAELGARLTVAMQKMGSSAKVDEEAFEACMKDVTRALLEARRGRRQPPPADTAGPKSDVNVASVVQLKKNVVKAVNIRELAAGLNPKNVIERAVFSELVRLVDGTCGGAAKPFSPKRGSPCVVMFVGLQGAGKTTTATKYAYHYARKGFRPALVCADTFRAGAFDQLKQNATKARIPFYGSYTEPDPARIAAEGVHRFRAQRCDMIIVDTSGRHKQEASLFDEMRAVASAVQPSLTIFVMDASMGQAVGEQAAAFRATVEVGGVIVTKTDGHARGGGALAAVAATRSPVLFLGTGEHADALEAFDAKAFVGRLLGRGDLAGLADRLAGAMPPGQEEELMDRLEKGAFTLRLMQQQFTYVSKLGPMSALLQLLPGAGASAAVPRAADDDASRDRIRGWLTLMDSMTAAELDSPDGARLLLGQPSRLERLARGAGRPHGDAVRLVEQYRSMAAVVEGLRGVRAPRRGAPVSAQQREGNLATVARAVPPHLLRQLGGTAGLAKLMSAMDGGGGKGGGKGGA